MRNRKNKAFRRIPPGFALACALGLLASPAASADPITVTLNDVTFGDGGTLTGSFVLDPDTGALSDFSLSAAGGDTSTFAPFTYNSSDATAFDDGQTRGTNDYEFEANGGDRYVVLGFSPNFTDAGGVVDVVTSVDILSESVIVDDSISSRSFSGGTATGVVPAAVPEPSSLVLMGLGGLAGVGYDRRRRRAGVVA